MRRIALLLLCLASPVMAETRAERCFADAYNFDTALALRDGGMGQAQVLAQLQAMFGAERSAAYRALPAVVRAAFRYQGRQTQTTLQRYEAACLKAN